MKKFFTLISVAMMAMTAYAQTEPVTYSFAGITSDMVIVDAAGEKYTRSFDGVECPCVKYTATDKSKLNVTFSTMDLLALQFSNSGAKSPVVTFAGGFANIDTKNFIIILGNDTQKLKAGDKIYVEFSAKGSTAATIHAETNVTSATGEDYTSSAKDEKVIAEFTVGANGTCKIKETTGGFRLHRLSINQSLPTTGINGLEAPVAKAAVKRFVNGQMVIVTADGSYNLAGVRIK